MNIGAREAAEAELLLPLCDAYTQDLYHRTQPCATGKMLAAEVSSASILRDVEQLIALRAASRKNV